MNKKAVTLMELIIVVVVFAIIAAMAVPSFQKTLQKENERNMALQLKSIDAALVRYQAKNGQLPVNLRPYECDSVLGLKSTIDYFTYTANSPIKPQTYSLSVPSTNARPFTLSISNTGAYPGGVVCSGCLSGVHL